MDIVIRQETPQDYDEVYDIHHTAFEQHDEAELVNLLRKEGSFVPELSLVGCINDNIVGHCICTTVQVIDGDNQHTILALAPMAVSPSLQKQGIGTALVNESINIARQLGYPGIVLLGHAWFYPKFGFTPASGFGIKCPYDVPDEAYMALELTPGALDSIQGTVRYPDVFENVS